MILHHLVLDVTALSALSGNRQVSALIHRAHFEVETRLWVPVLSALEADREHPGLAEHLGQLDVLHTVDLDYPAMLTVARLRGEGVAPGIGAAIHVVRHLPQWGTDALVATVDPKAYEGHGVALFDLNR
ncbi:hypothetical protein [Streptomyces vietnamensis]|uniref:PIN domain-containing protein n=1 Tax=Streptomyces vietnamensis TaxID=362257 RepID=A0A0B5I5N4_9ACTN|nr:hypothetical protein [Streptomyces vietnamensis]AJF69405.1 hypothetical protein SVTN_39325 [Streptomyces vietnamensis]